MKLLTPTTPSDTPLYDAQLSILQAMSAFPFDKSIVLCGGTALARAYLHHRVSYDLDFFIDSAFQPHRLERALMRHGIHLIDVQIENGGSFADQLFGTVKFNDVNLKVSFIEDAYADMFTPKQSIIDGVPVLIDSLDGLYHRKLRTITGNGNADVPTDGRQKARDLFDLYALDKMIEPLPQFLKRINSQGANVPEKALSFGLTVMPWHNLLDEFEQIRMLNPQSIDWPEQSDLMGSVRDRMRHIVQEISPHAKKIRP